VTVGRGIAGVPAGPEAHANDGRWTEPGAMIGDDYRVERVLGAGGMGVVVEARDVRSGERVAIKLIHPERGGERTFVKRFFREARITLQLKGPRVARVLRLGELDTGLPYLVMEYLDGVTLDQVLAERGALPVETAVDYVLQACDAIAEAHALGIVHRDLKPGNLFVARGADGQPIIKVIDFGISKRTAPRLEPSETNLTTTAGPIGSPRYMSPEQLSEVAIADLRSDLWALGVILFELVSGRHPFEGESLANLYVRILRDDVPALRAFKSDVPAGLEAVCRRCLARERAARMPGIHDLVIALAPYASASGRALAQQIAARAPASPTTVAAVAGARRRPRWPVTAVAVVCGVGGLYFGVRPVVSKVIARDVASARETALGRVESRAVPAAPAVPVAAAPAPAPVEARAPAALPAIETPPAPRARTRTHASATRASRSHGARGTAGPPATPPKSAGSDSGQDLFGTRR